MPLRGPTTRNFPANHRWFDPNHRWFDPNHRWFDPDQRWFDPNHRRFASERRRFEPDRRRLEPDRRSFESYYRKSLTAGDPIKAAYLGGSCEGTPTPARAGRKVRRPCPLQRPSCAWHSLSSMESIAAQHRRRNSSRESSSAQPPCDLATTVSRPVRCSRILSSSACVMRFVHGSPKRTIRQSGSQLFASTTVRNVTL